MAELAAGVGEAGDDVGSFAVGAFALVTFAGLEDDFDGAGGVDCYEAVYGVSEFARQLLEGANV